MVATIVVSLLLILSLAFLIRAVVKVASKLSIAYYKLLPPSTILGLTLLVVLFAPPSFALPLVTICYSVPSPPSDSILATTPTAIVGVEL
jgi:hypothetical protein